ncbi:hypothetical protein [Natrialba swarupiae]|nr:hypothetical protein [Natrialba swarupiae]
MGTVLLASTNATTGVLEQSSSVEIRGRSVPDPGPLHGGADILSGSIV